MPTVVLATVQNSPFILAADTNACSYWAYQRRDGQAEWAYGL